MDQYTLITEDLYKNIGIFKTIYEAGNISISNFFEKINIDKIEAEQKQAIQTGSTNDYSSLVYDLCDFHSEFQSRNIINLANFDKLEKGILNLKDIYDALQDALKDQTQHIVDISNDNKKLKEEKEADIQRIKEEIEHDKAQEIQQLKEENSRYLNAFNNLKVESKSDKKAKEQIQELIDENKSLNNKLKSEEKKSRQFTNLHNESLKKYDKLSTKYNEATQKVGFLERKIKQFDDKISNQKKSIEVKDRLISAKDNMLAMRNKKIDALNKENKELKSKIISLSANESLNFIGEEQEKLIKKLNDENQNLQHQIDELLNEIKKQKKEKQKLEQKSTVLNQKVSELENANDELFQKIDDINEEKSKLQRKVANSMKNEEKLKDLQSEIEKLKKENYNVSQVPREKTIEFLREDSIKNLEKMGSIESGGNSVVYKVAKKVIYALKEMKLQIVEDEIQNFIAEYELMRILEHPNIVKTHGIYFGDEINPPSILLEYCPLNLGSLFKNKQIKNIELVFMIYQIVEGMKYIHLKKVIHLDLKPLNILIGENNEIKIGDFGISVLKENEGFLDKEEVEKASFKFAAPEILNGGKCNEKVDVYSFGVILFFLLSRGQMPEMIPGQILNGIKAKIPDTFTEFASQLISSCWNFNPNDRPSFEQIYDDIENNDFKLIEMDETEIDEVKKMIKNHKMKIPNY